MRYDCGSPLNRITLMESVVDLILGFDEGENHDVDLIEEDDIRFFASRFPFGSGYYLLLTDKIISQGIRYWNSLPISPVAFSNEEMALIREEFLERFIKRIKRYSGGRRPETSGTSICLDQLFGLL